MARRSLFLVLALAAAGCAQTPKHAPPPTLTPAQEAAQIDAAEAALYDTRQSLALEPGVLKLAPVARRDAAGLTLMLENGRSTTLADAPSCADQDAVDCTRYSLAAWLPSHHLFVVDVAHYEGFDCLLVDTRDGARLEVPAPPHFSPDGTRFATALVDVESESAIDIWQLGPKGYENVWHDGRLARFVRWDGDDALVVGLYRDNEFPPGGKTLPARIVRGAAGWTLVPEKVAKR